MRTLESNGFLLAGALFASLVPAGASAAADGVRPAVEIPRLGSGVMASLSDEGLLADIYQMGSTWGKHPVSSIDLTENPAVARAVSATGSLGGATTFYLGTFNGKHVIATNRHVCPTAQRCLEKTVRFPVLGIATTITEFYGSWPEIDLALLAVALTPSEAAVLDRVGRNFDFNASLYAGEPLVTAGFGVYRNEERQLVVGYDHDCCVFSAANDFRFMFDPDRINPSRSQVWSFATGCDISHGDSGSAMVDRNTGDVIGIIWTGAFPKREEVQDSNYLDAMLASEAPEIWTELNYGVPAKMIGAHLRSVVEGGTLSDTARETIIAILGG
jgi:hypothetical protein